MKKLDIHPTNLVIMFLGIWGTIGLIGVLHLVIIKTEQTSIAIVTTLVAPVFGSMGSILANALKPPTDPVQATITNTPDNPVPTTNEGADTTSPDSGQKDNPNE